MAFSVTPSTLTASEEFVNINTSFVVGRNPIFDPPITSVTVTKDSTNGNVVVAVGAVTGGNVTVTLTGLS